VSERVERSQPAGTVVSQSPAPSALARKGAPVALLVAKAPPSAQKVIVPNVLGEGKRAALRKLKAAGLEPSLPLIELPVSEPALAGTIIKQVPAAGRHVRRGTEITLYLGGSSLSSSSTSTSSATSSTTSSATSSSSSPPAPGG
jgi:serine/threonine-protein kinase